MDFTPICITASSAASRQMRVQVGEAGRIGEKIKSGKKSKKFLEIYAFCNGYALLIGLKSQYCFFSYQPGPLNPQLCVNNADFYQSFPRWRSKGNEIKNRADTRSNLCISPVFLSVKTYINGSFPAARRGAANQNLPLPPGRPWSMPGRVFLFHPACMYKPYSNLLYVDYGPAGFFLFL